MKRILVLPDMHVPYEDRAAVTSVLKFAQRHAWDVCIQLGDFMDINAISGHNEGKPKLVEGERLSEDFAYAGKVLDRILGACRKRNPSCKMVLITGNHEARIDRFVERHPALEGLVDFERLLELKRRKVQLVKFYPDGELYRVGKLCFGHGAYTVKHHAAKHLDQYGLNLIYGHTHTIQSHTKSLHGHNRTLSAWSVGMLCRHDMPYLQGKPTAWHTAFAVVHVAPSGDFSINVVPINAGQFVCPYGKVYKS